MKKNIFKSLTLLSGVFGCLSIVISIVINSLCNVKFTNYQILDFFIALIIGLTISVIIFIICYFIVKVFVDRIDDEKTTINIIKTIDEMLDIYTDLREFDNNYEEIKEIKLKKYSEYFASKKKYYCETNNRDFIFLYKECYKLILTYKSLVPNNEQFKSTLTKMEEAINEKK